MISSYQRLPWLALITFILSCLVLATESQLAGKLTQNPCVNKATCRECIQTLDCAWCSEPYYDDKPRCFLQYNNSNICEANFVYNPSTTYSLLMARELSRTSGGAYYANSAYSSSSSGFYSGSSSFDSSEDIVQISPQRVALKLRINEVYNLQFRYSQAKDYPVDLYYLMGLSKSMEGYEEKLSALGDLLSETISNITSNFRLGFGSFVDKVSPVPKKVYKGPVYHYPLPPTLHQTEVKRAATSGNLDAPVGGLDAIMQAIACRQQIGWREQARRLLVFSTDAEFHFAGDGKLGGIIAPNDGKCHLNSAGLYTHSANQDYPSISQISQKVKQNSINVIFAVTANQHVVYEKLSKHIEGSSSAVLSNDSSNVVDLVREEYGKISSSIELKDNATSHFKITYYSKCLHGAEIATSKCDGLKVGDVVSFTAKIQVTSCPSDPAKWNQVIGIYPVGINQGLVIDLEMLCSCDCERPGSLPYEINSPQCNNHGNVQCGLCECDDMYFGHSCECYTSDMEMINDFGCRAHNTSMLDCSGRGSCVCGVCECEMRANMEEVISGRFCECDNFSCERHDQQLCSGTDHGSCECGVCACKPGWSGSGCSCKTSNENCIPPNGGEICSGHGECICGKCECNSTDVTRYTGDHCEYCPTCPNRCQELKDCTQCQMYRSGPLRENEDCRTNCTLFTPIAVDKVEIDENKGEYLCIFYDEFDCIFKFKYREEDNKIIVMAQAERECPSKRWFNMFGTW